MNDVVQCCPTCGAQEVEADTPRTTYACGSSDYDQRPGTFDQKCSGGCPRHPGGERSCIDVRCLRTWKPDGAPTADEQLRRWVTGESVCPNEDHECCPDFSCCRPHLRWPEEKRRAFAAADRGTREKMLMGALGSLAADVGVPAHVTRGDPVDHGGS